IRRALELDPGPVDGIVDGVEKEGVGPDDLLPKELVTRLLPRLRSPGNLATLAALAADLESWDLVVHLLRRYLQIGPEAQDRDAVEHALTHAILNHRLGTANLAVIAAGDFAGLLEVEQALLDVDPGYRPSGLPALAADPVDAWIDDVLSATSLRTLSVLRAGRGDFAGAESLWRRWRRDWPDDPELAAVSHLIRPRSEPRESALGRLWDRLRRSLMARSTWYPVG
ncbi:MAG: hypothetical protein AAFY88_18910, partial [Acidobacteriota bacterium]